MGRLGKLRIGASGYQYKHWKGVFYPEELPQKKWFEYYAGHFDTVEVNNTFYRLPAAHVFEAWRDAAPPGFCYALKFSRFGSHLKRLLTPEATIGLFLERAELLSDSLGPILVQLPPRWSADPQRLADFLRVAPRKHRWSVEFRDKRWLNDEVFSVLRRYKAALCIHDMIKDHPREATTDWLYLRYHGAQSGGNYTSKEMKEQAGLIEDSLRRGYDVYAYFNNDVGGHAIHNAKDLLSHFAGQSPKSARRHRTS